MVATSETVDLANGVDSLSEKIDFGYVMSNIDEINTV